jgi:hypothetical protein
MLRTISSSIPTNVRDQFDVQDLPARASSVSEDTLKMISGGVCYVYGSCSYDFQCCSARCYGGGGVLRRGICRW